MTTTSHPIEVASFDELLEFVERQLCGQGDLEPGVFPLTHRPLLRRGQQCGAFFCLHGPRRVRLTAVWDAAVGRVLSYDSAGKRVGEFAVRFVADDAE